MYLKKYYLYVYNECIHHDYHFNGFFNDLYIFLLDFVSGIKGILVLDGFEGTVDDLLLLLLITEPVTSKTLN